ncbi:VOC family protein [Brevibacterium aurantiacum]|uniref:VOC family protein n=1 Tax=Brevibacterium aurantiacum TaxID=273384 RepID=UPI001F44C032|nr:VOC family protein [Brevibacterium aurantiacum]
MTKESLLLSVGSIVFRVTDIDRQEEFWVSALDYKRQHATDDFVLLCPRAGGGPNLSLDMVHSQRVLPPRIHLDLYADDQDAEVARLAGLGAREVHWPGRPADADYIIMEDPEGNRFCVIEAGVYSRRRLYT